MVALLTFYICNLPLFDRRVGRSGNRKHGFLIDTRVTTLVESNDIDIMSSILLNNTLSIFVSVEGVHENERNTDIMFLVQVLRKQTNKMRNNTTNRYILFTSIWRTLKSKKVIPSRTSIADLGPTQPIVVPKPPFNFKTANFWRSEISLTSGILE